MTAPDFDSPLDIRSAADVTWLRELAQRIVRDACDADDVLQDAIANSLAARSRSDRPGWWARVIQRGAIDRHRAGERRRQRELERPHAAKRFTPSTHAVVAEAETRKIISDAVLSLDEPYRTVVLLRYSHGQSPRAIAAELNRPVGTVKVQLERARAQLRQRLARHFPSDRDLVLALAPVAGLHGVSWTGLSSTALATAGAPLVMKIAWLVPFALLAIVGVIWVTVSEPRSVVRTGPAQPEVVAEDEGRSASQDAQLATPSRPNDRRAQKANDSSAVASALNTAPDPTPNDAVNSPETGLATTIDGRPWPRLALQLDDPAGRASRTTTDDAGKFECRARDSVAAANDDVQFVTERRRNGVREVRFTSTVRFAGRVVNGADEPVAGVMIQDSVSAKEAGLADDPNAPWSQSSSMTSHPRDDGEFDLPHVATWPGRTITFFSAVYGTRTVPVPSIDTTDARVVFERASGTVDVTLELRDELGQPLRDAAALVWTRIERPNEDGTIEIAVDARISGTEILVTRPGYAPVTRTLPTLDELRLRPEARTIEIVIDRLGGSIRGVVVDGAGEPVAGAKIGLWNGRPFGFRSVAETVRFDAHGETSEGPTSAADGSFQLDGLVDHPYTIRAVLADPLRVAEAPMVPIGTSDLRLVIPSIERTRTIRGRVEDLAGDPVAGAHVRAEARLLEPQGDPRFESGRSIDGQRVISGEDGTFALDGVVPDGVRLRADFRGSVAVCDAADESPVLVVDVPCMVVVHHAHSARGRALIVVDSAGEALRFSRIESDMVFSGYERYEANDEVTETKLHVSQRARQIRLMDGERIIARIDVQPDRHQALAVEL